jgi:hypothetical protein
MKDAGCHVQLLTTDFTLRELKAANFDVPSLRSSGYSLSDMNVAGFSASSLVAVGCGAKELKDAGFSALELRSANFNLPALDTAGFNVDELKSANFTDAEISQTATFANADAAIQKARVHVATLKSLGAGDALTQRQAEDIAGKVDFFKRIQIRAAIDDLVDVLCHPSIVKNSTTALSLREFGVKACYLLAAGFSQPTLVAAAYSSSELSLLTQCEYSYLSPALMFVYKHWRPLLVAWIIALTSISIGLGLGDVISMLILVICVPNFVMCFAHWRCVTHDGSKYPVKWAIGFAACFVAVFCLSAGIMLGMPPKLHGIQAAIIIFAVVIPIIIFFAFHYVHWSSSNVGLPYPLKYKVGFALVLACIVSLSLGLILGLPTRPLAVSFNIAVTDRKAGKTDVPVTLSFTPSVFGGISPGGTITLSYPASFFVPSVTPAVAAGASSVAGLTATCGATTNTYIVITTVQTSSNLLASAAVDSGRIS